MGKGFHLRSHYAVKWKNAADAEAGSEEEKMFCAPGVWKGAAVAGQGSRAEMQQHFPSHHGLGGSADGDPLGKDLQQRLGVSVVQPCLGAKHKNVWLSKQKEEETAAGRCLAIIPRLFFF